MSFQAMAWAVDIKLPVKEKITLLMLANYASNESGDCYPSINTLADSTGMSRDSVMRAIKSLEDLGLLKVNRRQVEGVNLPNSYTLNLRGVVAHSGEGSSTQQGGVVAGSDSNLSTKPINKPKKNSAGSDTALIDTSCFHEQPSESVWNDYLKHRKAKRAPVNQTVIKSMAKELEIAAAAGWSVDDALSEAMSAGWQGLKAAWLISRSAPRNGLKQSSHHGLRELDYGNEPEVDRAF